MTQGNSLCVHSDKHNALRTGEFNATGDSPPLLVALLCPAPGLRMFIQFSSFIIGQGLRLGVLSIYLGVTRSSNYAYDGG